MCNPAGGCFVSDVIAAIEYIVFGDDGIAQSGDEPARIISMSLGAEGTRRFHCNTDFLAQRVNWAVLNGVSVVAAAGNTAGVVAVPACASGAIAVGAVDTSNVRTPWSGSGRALDIVAPGVDIFSTSINGYAPGTGTSMAAPHVAGAIALLLEKNKNATEVEVKKAVLLSASNKTLPRKDLLHGWGTLDVAAALERT